VVVFAVGYARAGTPSREAARATGTGAPRIGMSDTVVSFRAKRLGPVPSPVTIQILNTGGVGLLSWDASADRSWIATTPSQATSNETDVAVWIVNTDAQMGHHVGHLIIDSWNAINAPETLFVVLDMLCPVSMPGDVNGDGRLSQSDIIFLVNHVLRAGPPPQPVWQAGDANCDGALSQSDIIVLVNNLLRAGPTPCDVCQYF
jgi:hypothetical protein